MNRLKLLSKIMISNSLIFFLLLEASGLFIHFNVKGVWFYNKVEFVPSPKTFAERETKSRLMLHPVLGQIRRPGTSIKEFVSSTRLNQMYSSNQEPPWVNIRANNYGFFSPHEYPHVPKKKTYIIGVFGGSVAQWFSLQGSKTLVKALEAHAHIGEKPIELINFAQGGYKQPQQLLALSYFLSKGQPLDFVINLDGFNEIALSHINIANNLDPGLPNSQTLLPLVSLSNTGTEDPDQLLLISKSLLCERKLAITANKLERKYLASYWLVHYIFQKKLLWQKLELEKKLAKFSNNNSNSSIHLNTWLSNGTTDKEYRQVADIWMNASETMSNILNARKIPYLHVIQPNQYFSKKPLSQLEKDIAIDPNSLYSGYIKMGYPLLIDRIPLLQAKGVTVVSAVDIFENTNEATYSDSCCHLNQYGNEMLASFVSKQMDLLLAKKYGE